MLLLFNVDDDEFIEDDLESHCVGGEGLYIPRTSISLLIVSIYIFYYYCL
jgi:hypothetical protein